MHNFVCSVFALCTNILTIKLIVYFFLFYFSVVLRQKWDKVWHASYYLLSNPMKRILYIHETFYP